MMRKENSSRPMPIPGVVVANPSTTEMRRVQGREMTKQTEDIRYRPVCHPSLPDCPWLIPNKYYATGKTGLHDEIEDFYRYILPTREETCVREAVIEKIRGVVVGIWPEAHVDIFGSFRTGLYLPTSDIDIMITNVDNNIPNPLEILHKQLLSSNIAERNIVLYIRKTVVPIIKLTDRITRVKVDICRAPPTGIRAAELISNICKEYPSLPKIFMVLKQLLSERDLNEVFQGGLGSYALSLMVLHYFQMHESKSAGRGTPDDNLGALLLGFLEFYGEKFNYNDLKICVKNGGSYIQKTDKLSEVSLSIEDPLNPENDVGRASHKVLHFRLEFQMCYHNLKSGLLGVIHGCPQRSFLCLIVRFSEDLVRYRLWIIRYYSSMFKPRPSLARTTHAVTTPASPSSIVRPEVLKALKTT